MRIAYLVNAPREHLTGAAKRALLLAAAASDRGHSALVVGPAGSGLQREATRRGIGFAAASFSVLGLGMVLRALLKRERPDVVHAMSTVPALLASPRLLLGGAGHHRAVFVSIVVDPDSGLVYADARPRPLVTRLRTWLLARVSPSLDCVFAVSEPVRVVLSQHGVRGVVTVGGAAIDEQSLIQRAAGEVDLPPGHPRIGSAVGQLETAKGVDVLISAFARIAAEFPQATLLVAGEGSQCEELHRQADSAGLAPRVHLLGYLLEPAPFLAALDMHVSASLTEGLGTVTAQAMALGVPVVATDVGGATDLVIDGVTGTLVAPGDIGALADAMRHLLSDPNLARTLARDGREHVLEHHTAASFVNETWAHYERTVAGRGRS